MSYFSSCSFGFIGRVSAEPVAIAVSKTNKIEKMLDVVENFIRWSRWSGQTRAIPDSQSVMPNRGAGALPYARTAILSRIIPMTAEEIKA